MKLLSFLCWFFSSFKKKLKSVIFFEKKKNANPLVTRYHDDKLRRDERCSLEAANRKLGGPTCFSSETYFKRTNHKPNSGKVSSSKTLTNPNQNIRRHSTSVRFFHLSLSSLYPLPSSAHQWRRRRWTKKQLRESYDKCVIHFNLLLHSAILLSLFVFF